MTLALAAQTLLNNWDNGEVVLQENMEALRDALASCATDGTSEFRSIDYIKTQEQLDAYVAEKIADAALASRATAQATGGEREAFEAEMRKHMMPASLQRCGDGYAFQNFAWIAWQARAALTTQAPAGKACKYGDELCPCQDGDACHYEGEKPFTQTTAEPIAAAQAPEAATLGTGVHAVRTPDAAAPFGEPVVGWRCDPTDLTACARIDYSKAQGQTLTFGGAAPTPVEPARTTERHIAWREAHEIEKEDSYFKARQHLDDERGRHLFRMGFERGFDAGEKVYAAPAVEPGNPANQAPAIEWPKSRSVKSRADMHPTDALEVGLDDDNDVTVSLWTECNGYSSVEFCNGGGGGGKHPNTRRALIALMAAMEKDAAGSADSDHAKGDGA